MNQFSPDQRRTVCRALTSVLEQSELAGDVDPRAFFMLLSANYDALVRGRSIDLGPLWSSLAPEHAAHPALPGLFLGFELEAKNQGLSSFQPRELDGLDFEARQAALRLAFGSSGWGPAGADGAPAAEPCTPDGPHTQPDGPSTEPSGIPVSDLALERPLPELGSGDLEPVEAPLPELTSQDLLPVEPDRGDAAGSHPNPPPLPEHQRRDLVNALVKSVRESPDGHLIDGAQLGFQIDANFAALCDGGSLDVAPLVESLRGVEGFSERSIYAALVVAHRTTSDLEIDLIAPAIQLSEAEMSEVVAEIRTRAKERSRVEASVNRSPAGKPKRASGSGNTGSLSRTKEARLRRYHLLGMDPKRLRLLRRAAMAVTLLGLGTFGWFTRPDRPLDPVSFPMPLKSAELVGRQFIGRLNDAAWYKQPQPKRRAVMSSMGDALKGAGMLSGAVIYDGRGRVIAKGSGVELKGSRWLLESPDGSKPPPPGEAIDPITGAPVKKAPK